MSLEKHIAKADQAIGKQWAADSNNCSFTEEEARIASVLTRMDTQLNAHLLSYNAKVLSHIRTGVWALVVIGIIQVGHTYFIW